jgi:hypothetical protein
MAPDTDDRRLVGGWLMLARLVSVSIVVFALSDFAATALPRFTLLRVVCATACYSGQLTAGQASALAQAHLSVGAYGVFAIALLLATSLVWFGAAALIFWRRSDTLFMLLAATQLVMEGALNSPTRTAITSPHSLVWPAATASLSTLNNVLFLAFLGLFPTGRFVPRWLGWLLIPASAALIVTQFPPFTAQTQINVIVVCLAGLIGAQGYRFRVVSTPLQRQQTRWVILGIGLSVVVQFVLSILPTIVPAINSSDSLYPVVAGSVSTLTLALGPIAFTIAILRYRLFDLDLLVNRTLVYGSLTALLASVYVGCVVGLQALARGVTGQQNSAVAITLSTLLIATLFQPLRRRLQTVIDLRFYRRKYDAAKTLSAFSATLRSEIDLDSLCQELVTAVTTSLQPTQTWLLVRPIPGHSHLLSASGA